MRKKSLRVQLHEAGLRVLELEKQREDICIALGIYRNEHQVHVIEKCKELAEIQEQQETRSNTMRITRDTEKKVEDSLLRIENDRLWYLVRSLSGDKTLSKEIERTVVTALAPDRFGEEKRFVTPFNSSRF